MKKVIFFTLLSLLIVQTGCESHHNDTSIQEQQEAGIISPDVTPSPQNEPARGNADK